MLNSGFVSSSWLIQTGIYFASVSLLPNKPLRLTGHVPLRLDAVALGKSRTPPAGGSGGPAAERRIR